MSEELNYHRAADRLFISQPSLSIQIHKLEKDLDCLLFEKKGRHIELTDGGSMLIPQAKDIILRVREAQNRMAAFGSGGRNQIKIGSSGSYLVYPAIKEFSNLYPSINLSVSEHTTSETLVRVLNRSLDFGVAFIPVSDPNIDYKFLFNDEIIAVVRSDGQFKSLTHISLSDIASTPIASLTSSFYVRKIMDQAFHQQMLIPKYRFEVGTYQNCINMTRLTDCIGIVTRSFFDSLRQINIANDLKIISIDDPLRKQMIGLVHRNDSPLDQPTEAFANLITNYYTQSDLH